MTYQKFTPKRLFLDIETQANPESCALMPEPEAPANYTDPVKIERYKAEKRAELIDKAALDPDYGQILSIGGHIINTTWIFINRDAFPDYHNSVFVQAISEPDMLDLFWRHFADCRGVCVGYNILSFDLPYLLRRSMALGVGVPCLPVLARYRTEPVTDLMQILYNWGSDRYKGLKQVAKLYGLPVECPEVDGSQVKNLSAEELIAYQVSDVKLTVALYQRMNGIYFQH
jgi:DNA polymerase elongation subunit (family B)